MDRILLLVPRMYTEEEFKSLVETLPTDFESKTLEFWSYVEEKLEGFVGRTQRIYRDEVCSGGKEGLAYLSSIDHESFAIVRKFVEKGAGFEATEDSLLIAESKSWLDMTKQDPLGTMTLELYQETVRERDGYVTRRIDETLLDGETGILFLKPGREIDLKERIKVIKVCRFDPTDYLRSWQVQLRTRSYHSDDVAK